MSIISIKFIIIYYLTKWSSRYSNPWSFTRITVCKWCYSFWRVCGTCWTSRSSRLIKCFNGIIINRRCRYYFNRRYYSRSFSWSLWYNFRSWRVYRSWRRIDNRLIFGSVKSSILACRTLSNSAWLST